MTADTHIGSKRLKSINWTELITESNSMMSQLI
jgi:hypothetical protein